MATATLTSQLTDVLLDPGAPTNVGTANAQASETVIQLQGANAAATGHSGAVGPTAPTAISGFRGMYSTVTGFTRTDMHLHIWVRDLYPIRNKNVGGVSVYLFGTSEAIYYVTGLDENYVGGWYHAILNLDAGDRPAASLGTAPSANITRIGYCGNISATKGEAFLQNCYFDAVRRGTGGQGISFYGGTSGDRLTFLNCTVADTSRYGLFRNVAGALFIDGCLTWGVAAQTTYLQESLATLNFSNLTVRNGTSGATEVPAVASDYYRIVFATGTITDIDFVDVTLKGVSRAIPFSLTASALVNNGSPPDSYASLRTTYIFGSTITLGPACTSQSDVFVECVTIDPNGVTLNSPTFSNCDAVDLTVVGSPDARSEIDGGVTNLHNTLTGVSFITTDDLSKIANHSFNNTGGVGHAIEITVPGTYTFIGNLFTGYAAQGASPEGNTAILNNSGGLVTINISGGGDTPSYTNAPNSPENTTVVNNNVNVTLTNIKPGTEVRVYPVESPINTTQIAGIESTGSPSEFTFSGAAGLAVRIVVFHIDYVLPPANELQLTIPNADTSFPISQIVDRNYFNP